MASSKLSALTAVTSVGDDDLLYVADTGDGGSTYASKKVTRANLFSGIATESYVQTQLTNLVDGAPAALDTLNELAAALADDASFSTTITNLINANETHIDNVATLTGLAKDSTDLGTFSGTTIADSQTIKAALQALETSVESKGSATSLTSLTTAVGDLNTLTGVAQNDEDLGSFSGSTITDSSTIKAALQELETAVEGNDSDISTLQTQTGNQESALGVAATATHLGTFGGSTITDNVSVKTALYELESAVEAIDSKTVDSGDNVNTLVANTSADTTPVDGNGADNYLFLVVNKSTGAIAAIDKTFLEAEG